MKSSILAFIFTLPFLVANEINWAKISSDFSSKDKIQEIESITPVYGGATNVNYDMKIQNEHYFVRKAEQTSPLLYANIEIEYEALSLLSPLGISPKPLYFSPNNRVLITEFIDHDHQKIDLLHSSTRKNICKLLHQIDQSNVGISRVFKPYDDVVNLIKLHSSLGLSFSNEFITPFLQHLRQIERILSKQTKLSLCHLDLHSKNVLQEKDRFWIVDWEYATMSHPYLTLASMASIERWDDQQMKQLLKDYNPSYTTKDFEILYLYRIVADMFWTVWNRVQMQSSKIENPYDVWAELFEKAYTERVSSDTFKQIIANETQNP